MDRKIFVWKHKRPIITQKTVFKKKNKVGRFALLSTEYWHNNKMNGTD